MELVRANASYKLISFRNDFRYRADAFRGVSDEPSPTLRVRCEGSSVSHQSRLESPPFRENQRSLLTNLFLYLKQKGLLEKQFKIQYKDKGNQLIIESNHFYVESN